MRTPVRAFPEQTSVKMVSPLLPESAELLRTLASATRLLQSGHPLALRIDSLFGLLQTTLGYPAARLTCWLQSAQPGAQRRQFVGGTRPPGGWDDGLMRQVALGGKLVYQPIEARSLTGPAASGAPATPGPGSYLGAPVAWSQRLWGVLELRGPCTAEEPPPSFGAPPAPIEEFLGALIPQLASAIAREGADLARRRALPPAEASATLAPRRVDLPTDLAEQLEEPLTQQQLLSLLLRRALDASGAEAGYICLVHAERAELVLSAHDGYAGYAPDIFGSEQQMGQGPTLPRWDWQTGLAGRAVQHQRALLVRDVTQEQDMRPTAASLRAELAVPILGRSAVLAVLVLNSPRSAAFGEAELAFVSALCAQAAWPLQRALAYQKLVETSTQLGQVFSSLPTGLALIDRHGQVLRTNPAWAQTWGITSLADQHTFHVPLDLTDALLPRLPDQLQLAEFCDQEQRSPDDDQTLTVRLTNPVQELQILSVPTRDSRGQMTGRLWAVSDMTRDREVDRLKHEFVSIVSHELRTPLTSILGYTELLLARSFAPDEQRQFVQTVYNQATHLSKLVEDLLSLSRLDSGNLKLNCWVVGLRQLLGELTGQLGQLERHRLLIRTSNNLPPVFIDRDKVKQILSNLITNAIKYSPNGGEVELAIREPLPRDLPADHAPGRWLLVSVSDEGIGIAPEDLPRIWERFYRVDNTNTRRIGGTGLGLSIARAFVELHGGRIWATSTLDRGSTFFFTLPVATDDLPRS